MYQSKIFTKTRREGPKDEVSKNAGLLIRAGFIHKEMAGAYDYLPLGLRVIEKIKSIIREEMNKIGGQEILMTTLQKKEVWEKTERWDNKKVDIWFKTALQDGGELGLGWSHEEPIAEMMKGQISSYRDLPISVYQFQNKLRNELRAKSGILRGREFLMKDLYSFCRSEEEHNKIYNEVAEAYKRIYERLGLGNITFFTFASGGTFTEFSHEFQTISENGEDTIFLDRTKNIAVNKEVYSDEVLEKLGLKKSDMEEVKAIEVGNIFNFGTSKSEQLGLSYKDENGHFVNVVMGSYGIGVSRLMGAIVEIFSDDKGIVWPESVAPFKFHLIEVGNTSGRAKNLYERLSSLNEVLYDDRDVRAGEKFIDADLLGIPKIIIVSDRGKEEGMIELKDRKTGKSVTMTEDELLSGQITDKS